MQGRSVDSCCQWHHHACCCQRHHHAPSVHLTMLPSAVAQPQQDHLTGARPCASVGHSPCCLLVPKLCVAVVRGRLYHPVVGRPFASEARPQVVCRPLSEARRKRETPKYPARPAARQIGFNFNVHVSEELKRWWLRFFKVVRQKVFSLLPKGQQQQTTTGAA